MDKRPITEQLELWKTEGYWQHAGRKGIRIPEKLSTLRQKLYQKAKEESKFRFYALYDRIFRKDVLTCAYAISRANGGAPGIDGVTFKEIESSPQGSDGFVDTLHEELRTKTYKPFAVRRVYIPKPDGRQRPLGIPAIRDRVVQMAALLILEPIFEADFLDCSYGFRPGRSAHDALKEIYRNLKQGRKAVYDADLTGYFDSIPHDKLMKCLRMRVTDRSVRYQGKRLREFVESKIESWLGLGLNQTKTKIVDLQNPGESFDFLGYTFRYDRDLQGRGHRYLNPTPSKKALEAEKEKLRGIIDKKHNFMPLPELIMRINRNLSGWSHYFGLGYPRVTFRKINRFVREGLTRHLHRRSQRPYRPPQGMSYYRHYKKLGLIYL